MADLAAACKIDRSYARRFPSRSFWIRPATPGERRVFLARNPDPAMFPDAVLCVAVGHLGNEFRVFPFWSSTADVTEATNDAAAVTIVKAKEALVAGTMASVVFRSGSKALWK